MTALHITAYYVTVPYEVTLRFTHPSICHVPTVNFKIQTL